MITILAATMLPPPEDPRAGAIAPFVGAEVFAVLHVDLVSLDLDDLADRVLSGVLEPGEIDEAKAGVVAWVEALRGAGAETLYVLVEPKDLPGLPVVVVPLVEGADGEAIGRILCGNAEGEPPVAWPTCAILRGAVFAGSDAALERIRTAGATPRPELDEAFAASGDGPARVLIIPSANQRRVIEELMPRLPESFGGLSTRPLTRGKWAVVALETEPNAVARAIVKAGSEEWAKELAEGLRTGLNRFGEGLRSGGSAQEFVEALGRIAFSVEGEELRIAVSLEQAGALVGIPVRNALAEASRARSVNNLKQIGLAMHNFASGNQSSLPPAYSTDAEGRPLLSWRVHILPYIEQKSLYDQFHLDEPWDSPHNKALIDQMPETYRGPGVSGEGMTAYLVPRGGETAFPGTDSITFRDVRDGTSNTIMVVEAHPSNAVVWTKPDDWEVQEGIDPAVLVRQQPAGFIALFMDGSARTFRKAISPEVLKALTTISGGEVISGNDF
ncbi:DUF1559 family PulG-like putative transporter [Tautonia rosea]|uniref:DUF1559 family PulG-like putative transporter n=1 Tax=Tautonia rosea TaxID=2728037 RepID=UPI0014753333|nr:DUF1559 domain-containing protein [Tautonia rosea]